MVVGSFGILVEMKCRACDQLTVVLKNLSDSRYDFVKLRDSDERGDSLNFGFSAKTPNVLVHEIVTARC